MHFHRELSHANSPLMDENEIKNLGIRKIHLAQVKFFDDMKREDLRDLKGNPLIYKPLALRADEPVVCSMLNYVTYEEARSLDPYDRSCHTFARSDSTLPCKTTELIRRAAGDDCYYKLVLGDVCPIAYYYNSTLAQLVGDKLAKRIMKKWAKEVLQVMLESADVIGFSAKSAHDEFCKLFEFKALYKENPEKFISALDDGSFGAPAHPCSLYNPGRLGAIETKLKRCAVYINKLRRIINPDASTTTFFECYREKNSALFELCQQAQADSCSRGGTKSGTEMAKRLKAALKRKANSEPLQEGDEKRIADFAAFLSASDPSAAGTEMAKRLKAALKRKANFEPLQEGDEKRIADFAAFQSASDPSAAGTVGGTEKAKRLKAALKRKANNKPLQEGDAKRIADHAAFLAAADRSAAGSEKQRRLKAALKRKANNEPLEECDAKRIADHAANQSKARAKAHKSLRARSNAYREIEEGEDVDDKTRFQGIKLQLKTLRTSITAQEKYIKLIPESMQGDTVVSIYTCRTCEEQTHTTRLDPNGNFRTKQSVTCNSIGCSTHHRRKTRQLPRTEKGSNKNWKFEECVTIREWERRAQAKQETLETALGELLLCRIQKFFQRKAINGGGPTTTQELLDEFDDLSKNDTGVFNEKLKSIAKFRRGQWILRS